jgi:hypothetical protein
MHSNGRNDGAGRIVYACVLVAGIWIRHRKKVAEGGNEGGGGRGERVVMKGSLRETNHIRVVYEWAAGE